MIPSSLIRRAIHQWLADRRAKRRARIAEQKEREREAIMRSIEYRRDHNMAWRPKLGELQRVTTEAIAAEIGYDRRAE